PPATIHFSLKMIVFEVSLDSQGNLQIDVAIAALQFNIGREVGWNFQSHAAVAGVYFPSSLTECRSSFCAGIYPAVTGFNIKPIKTTVSTDVSIARMSVERAIYTLYFKAAVAGVQFHVSF